jgi:hypothetical protein
MSSGRARRWLCTGIIALCAIPFLHANAQGTSSIRSPEGIPSAVDTPFIPSTCLYGDYPTPSVACGQQETVYKSIIAPTPIGASCTPESKVVQGVCNCIYHCPDMEVACNQTVTIDWVIDQQPSEGGSPCPPNPCAIKNGLPCPTPTPTPTITPTPLCGNKVIDPGEECDSAVPPECPQCSCTASCKLDCKGPCINNHLCSITEDGKVRLDVWWGPDVPAVGPGPLEIPNMAPWAFMPAGAASTGCCPERFWGTQTVVCAEGQKEVVFMGQSICPSAMGEFTGAKITCPCPEPIDCVPGDWPMVGELKCGEAVLIKRGIAVVAQHGGKDCPEETKLVTRECTNTPTTTPSNTPSLTPTNTATNTPTIAPTSSPTPAPTVGAVPSPTTTVASPTIPPVAGTSSPAATPTISAE